MINSHDTEYYLESNIIREHFKLFLPSQGVSSDPNFVLQWNPFVDGANTGK